MDEGKKLYNPSPILKANFLSRLFYWWLNDILKIGYKRNIEVSDIYNVVTTDSSKYLCDKLERCWNIELEKLKVGGRPSLTRALIRTFGVSYVIWGIILVIEALSGYFESTGTDYMQPRYSLALFNKLHPLVVLLETIKVVQPILLGGLILYFTVESNEVSVRDGYLYAMGVSICAIIPAIIHHPYFLAMFRYGMWIRIACCSIIYKKSLRISSIAFGQTTVGQIVNLMSNDVLRFDLATASLQFLVIGPVEVVAVFVILWYKINWSAVAGMSFLLLLFPITAVLGRIFARLRSKTSTFTDERVRLMNEVLNAMRLVKMCCWEKMFQELITEARKQEGKRIMRASYARALAYSPSFFSAKLIVFFTFLTYVLTGNKLTSEVVFVTMSLYNPVRMSMTFMFPMAIQFLSEALVAVHRIENFLLLDEKEIQIKPSTGSDKSSVPNVTASNVCATWDLKSPYNVLTDVNFTVGPGKLLVVVGPVGVGKTTLLMTLLHELPLLKGEMRVVGNVAYVAQQAWVFGASVRQNITFGAAFDSNKYNRVIKAAALSKDLELMAEGDQTLVGERGVSLSGGQKARVGLARALYYDADIYLLDDPLSAVDASVSHHIFHKCICGYLKKKLRILITHQLQYLPHADQILVLTKDEGVRLGTYEELSKGGLDFVSLLKREDAVEATETVTPPVDGVFQRQAGDVQRTKSDGFDLRKKLLTMSALSKSFSDIGHSPGKELELNRALLSKSVDFRQENLLNKDIRNGSFKHLSQKSSLSLISDISLAVFDDGVEFVPQAQEEESRAGTSISPKLYLKYFYAGGGICGLIVYLILNILAQISFLIVDWWLARWCNDIEEYDRSMARSLNLTSRIHLNCSGNETFSEIDCSSQMSNVTFLGDSPQSFPRMMLYLYIFIGLTFSVVVFGLLRGLHSFHIMITANQRLHRKMLWSLMRSPIAFFDNNPIGRILNRFSKDLGQIDDTLPLFMYDFLQSAFLVVGVILTVSIINPWLFLATVPMLACFLLLRHYFLKTARNIKRIEATAKSPMFSHVSATLLGIQTIRSYQAQGTFVEEFDSHQDGHTSAFVLLLLLNRWFAIRLEWLCAFFITAVAFCSVFVAQSLNGALVGLSLSYAITLMWLFQWVVRQSTEVESLMTSVERIVEYSELPSEAALESTDGKQPAVDWPRTGSVVAKDVVLKYNSDGPVVLDHLNFSINPGEKVGIVGRTGAGKSSLISLLFRMTEPEGLLSIDGINITSVGLHDVRKKISIIPQDPVLLNGTVRRNLDPLGEHTDLEIWGSLKLVQLGQAIEQMGSGLDSEIHEGGSNISMGQRQLFCLGRAMLKCNKLLVIDEATANVDPETDRLIQNTIREQFRNCTVLTIAHRLNTIIDSDRIMVLDAGKIVEFDVPFKLLQNSEGNFYKMAQQTGPTEFENLLSTARRAYDQPIKTPAAAALKESFNDTPKP